MLFGDLSGTKVMYSTNKKQPKSVKEPVLPVERLLWFTETDI